MKILNYHNSLKYPMTHSFGIPPSISWGNNNYSLHISQTLNKSNFVDTLNLDKNNNNDNNFTIINLYYISNTYIVGINTKNFHFNQLLSSSNIDEFNNKNNVKLIGLCLIDSDIILSYTSNNKIILYTSTIKGYNLFFKEEKAFEIQNYSITSICKLNCKLDTFQNNRQYFTLTTNSKDSILIYKIVYKSSNKKDKITMDIVHNYSLDLKNEFIVDTKHIKDELYLLTTNLQKFIIIEIKILEKSFIINIININNNNNNTNFFYTKDNNKIKLINSDKKNDILSIDIVEDDCNVFRVGIINNKTNYFNLYTIDSSEMLKDLDNENKNKKMFIEEYFSLSEINFIKKINDTFDTYYSNYTKSAFVNSKQQYLFYNFKFISINSSNIRSINILATGPSGEIIIIDFKNNVLYEVPDSNHNLSIVSIVQINNIIILNGSDNLISIWKININSSNNDFIKNDKNQNNYLFNYLSLVNTISTNNYLINNILISNEESNIVNKLSYFITNSNNNEIIDANVLKERNNPINQLSSKCINIKSFKSIFIKSQINTLISRANDNIITILTKYNTPLICDYKNEVVLSKFNGNLLLNTMNIDINKTKEKNKQNVIFFYCVNFGLNRKVVLNDLYTLKIYEENKDKPKAISIIYELLSNKAYFEDKYYNYKCFIGVSNKGILLWDWINQKANLLKLSFIDNIKICNIYSFIHDDDSNNEKILLNVILRIKNNYEFNVYMGNQLGLNNVFNLELNSLFDVNDFNNKNLIYSNKYNNNFDIILKSTNFNNNSIFNLSIISFRQHLLIIINNLSNNIAQNNIYKIFEFGSCWITSFDFYINKVKFEIMIAVSTNSGYIKIYKLNIDKNKIIKEDLDSDKEIKNNIGKYLISITLLYEIYAHKKKIKSIKFIDDKTILSTSNDLSTKGYYFKDYCKLIDKTIF